MALRQVILIVTTRFPAMLPRCCSASQTRGKVSMFLFSLPATDLCEARAAYIDELGPKSMQRFGGKRVWPCQLGDGHFIPIGCACWSFRQSNRSASSALSRQHHGLCQELHAQGCAGQRPWHEPALPSLGFSATAEVGSGKSPKLDQILEPQLRAVLRTDMKLTTGAGPVTLRG